MMEVTSRSSYFLGLRVWAWKQVLHRSHLLEGRTVQTLSTACCHCQKSWKQRSSPKTKLMSAAGGNCLILHGLSSEKRYFNTASRNESDIMEPDIFRPPQRLLNFGYLCSHENTEAIEANIRNRKGVGNIQQVLSLWKAFQEENDPVRKEQLLQELDDAAAEIPNRTHPDVPIGDESKARLVNVVGEKPDISKEGTPIMWKTMAELGKELGILRTSNVKQATGPDTYYLKGALALMEEALIHYTLDHLARRGFTLMSVPDLVHPAVIEACGFKTTAERTQVFKLEPAQHGQVCLSGTGEMPLAAFFMNRHFEHTDLPQKVCTVSRCYRAETGDTSQDSAIYRVRQFTKVEMFAVTASENGYESERLLEEFLQTQRELFRGLDLHFRVLDMPSEELGASAYRKYDMEAWMPGRNAWGEISSASNCTDYQSRRLDIRYHSPSDAQLRFCHTINGTACAVPRMLMAVAETMQRKDRQKGLLIDIPRAIQPYMDNMEYITQPEKHTKMKWIQKPERLRKQPNIKEVTLDEILT